MLCWRFGRSIKLRDCSRATGLDEAMPSLRILFYIHALAGGGAERVFALLASGLAERGQSVTMVNDFGASDNSHYLHKAVRSVVLGRGHVRGAWRLADMLKKERPDIILAALGASNLKMTIANLLAGRASALILTYHGRYSVERRPLGRLGYIATPVISRLADWTLAVSENLAGYVVRTWRTNPHRTSFIYNPIVVSQTSSTQSTEQSLSARPDLVLALGRLAPEKEFISLIRAFAKVPRPGSRLMILGEGSERPRLEAEVSRLGLAERVSLPGYVREPWCYFEQAKCFALTSREESFGNVVVEALAYGLPVVSTKCGGPEEILEYGRYGALVPVGDVGAIAEALDRALDSPGDPRPRLDRAAAFAVPAVTARYETLIESILAEKKQKRLYPRD
jgi:glycosyltransferase involved in cell wall biosynthesis